MPKVKIESMKERMEFVAPGKRASKVDVMYTTAKGYTGTIALPKEGLTEEIIATAIKGDMTIQEKLIDTEIVV